ncbi:sirohydrochlorin chelatase [Streptomyces sp. NPDC096310]|uniref:sirohydrochlorin chelatase n=1 Tax=Streptomyces sp. NPDC096310 TaxID=3366082 RepID=UPI00381DACF1
MTETAHDRMPPPPPPPPSPALSNPGSPAGLATAVPLPDSAARLFGRITAQLGHQLSHVAPNGARRSMDHPTLVVVAHGSRDPRALRTVTTLLDRVRELRPGVDVRLGHIEIEEPLLSDTLASLATGRAVLVPLLLGRGVHIKRDLPAFAAAAAPRLECRVAASLGPHPLLVETLYDRLLEAGWPTGPGPGRPGAHDRAAGVVLAAAGSRDPESAVDTRRTAALLSERLGGVPVLPAYASAASPTVPEALRALAARGRHRTAIASYFTAPGYFATRSAADAPWIAAAPLGAHPAMARLLLHRYDEALATAHGTTGHRLLAPA